MVSIFTTLFGKISHASLFITDQLRQMLAEPWGSTEPRLKNTDIDVTKNRSWENWTEPGTNKQKGGKSRTKANSRGQDFRQKQQSPSPSAGGSQVAM